MKCNEPSLGEKIGISAGILACVVGVPCAIIALATWLIPGPDIAHSDPFVVESVEFIPGGWGASEKTVVRSTTGQIFVVTHHVLDITIGKTYQVELYGRWCRIHPYQKPIPEQEKL